MRNSVKLNERDFNAIAEEFSTNPILLKVLCKVETGNKGGFLKDGRAVILFEGHIFWRELKKENISPMIYADTYPNIVYPKWDRKRYKGGVAEYNRLETAMSINRVAALRSASWGMFQVMGFNYQLCNESSIDSFVDRMNENEASQLRLTLNYMKNRGLLTLLNSHQWNKFALYYNGKGYKENKYDDRLQSAYNELSRSN